MEENNSVKPSSVLAVQQREWLSEPSQIVTWLRDTLPEAGLELGVKREYFSRMVLAHRLSQPEAQRLLDLRLNYEARIPTINSMLAAGLDIGRIEVMYETRQQVSDNLCSINSTWGGDRYETRQSISMTTLLIFCEVFPAAKLEETSYDLSSTIVEAISRFRMAVPTVWWADHALSIIGKHGRDKGISDLEIILGAIEGSEPDDDENWGEFIEHFLDHDEDGADADVLEDML